MVRNVTKWGGKNIPGLCPFKSKWIFLKVCSGLRKVKFVMPFCRVVTKEALVMMCAWRLGGANPIRHLWTSSNLWMALLAFHLRIVLESCFGVWGGLSSITLIPKFWIPSIFVCKRQSSSLCEATPKHYTVAASASLGVSDQLAWSWPSLSSISA